MTADQVQELIHIQRTNILTATKRIGLEQVLVSPQKIAVIERLVDGDGAQIQDQTLDVWLVGQERSISGYRIVMRDDGLEFGLASCGFPADEHLVLVGWYGDLESAFISR